jgi:hypothetical protein
MQSGNGIHTPNLCIAERVCQHCYSLDINTPCDHCQAAQRRFMFQGPTTLKDFMDRLLETKANDRGDVTFKNQDAIVIAHNFKGYDGKFILNYLVHTTYIKPSVILNRTKILCLEVCGIKFIDSYNFLPCALAKMPAAFGLSELKKGYFPYFFSMAENQNYVGPHPAAEYYNPDDMSISNRKAFYTWYSQQQGSLKFSKRIFGLLYFGCRHLAPFLCPIQDDPLCPRSCRPLSGIHYLCQYG